MRYLLCELSAFDWQAEAVSQLAPVLLVPFTEDLLPAVQPWFTDPEVQRRLGGPDWPARELRLRAMESAGDLFRGLRVLRQVSWVALDGDGRPVAQIGGEIYDRWHRYDGSQPDRIRVSAPEPGPAMALSCVVDPALWRRRLGRRVLGLVVGARDVADVRVFAAGIEADNVASRRCATAAGFRPDVDSPDWEGIVYYLLRRPAPLEEEG